MVPSAIELWCLGEGVWHRAAKLSVRSVWLASGWRNHVGEALLVGYPNLKAIRLRWLDEPRNIRLDDLGRFKVPTVAPMSKAPSVWRSLVHPD